MIDGGRHNVLGVRVNAVDYEAAVARIIDAARQDLPCSVSALAVHGLMTGALDKCQRYRLNRLDLVVPDGQPVRWALNWLYHTGLEDRVYGPQLMLDVCRRAAQEQLSIFLFGGSERLLFQLSERLREQFPTLQIAGTWASCFRTLSPVERDDLIAQIRDSGAAITFLGLGCPRQEVSAYELRDALGMPLVAVGAAFDFLGGRIPQAPNGLQRRGLEWIFRLWHEPRRLWKRYLLLNPLFVTLLLLQRVGLRTPDPDDAREPVGGLVYG